MKKFIKILRDEYLQKLIDRMVGKPGLRGKIDAKCIDCIYDPLQKGSWRYQVEECTSPTCPLFNVRPTTTNK